MTSDRRAPNGQTPNGQTPNGQTSDGRPAALPARHSALVITASDRAAAGTRDDRSGEVVAERLTALGFEVDRLVLPDDRDALEEALCSGVEGHALVVTTGGTGLSPRDVTPDATRAVVDYEVPGIGEAMREEGRRHTPMASLSRAIAGVRGASLIVNLPGSPAGAGESIDAIAPILGHALDTLRGPYEHDSSAAVREDPAATGDDSTKRGRAAG